MTSSVAKVLLFDFESTVKPALIKIVYYSYLKTQKPTLREPACVLKSGIPEDARYSVF
jgi:hypothetical protein